MSRTGAIGRPPRATSRALKERVSRGEAERTVLPLRNSRTATPPSAGLRVPVRTESLPGGADRCPRALSEEEVFKPREGWKSVCEQKTLTWQSLRQPTLIQHQSSVQVRKHSTQTHSSVHVHHIVTPEVFGHVGRSLHWKCQTQWV